MSQLIDMPIGEVFEAGGYPFVAVRRSRDYAIAHHCEHCAMIEHPNVCKRYACSAYDRQDKKHVWFKYANTTKK